MRIIWEYTGKSRGPDWDMETTEVPVPARGDVVTRPHDNPALQTYWVGGVEHYPWGAGDDPTPFAKVILRGGPFRSGT